MKIAATPDGQAFVLKGDEWVSTKVARNDRTGEHWALDPEANEWVSFALPQSGTAESPASMSPTLQAPQSLDTLPGETGGPGQNPLVENLPIAAGMAGSFAGPGGTLAGAAGGSLLRDAIQSPGEPANFGKAATTGLLETAADVVGGKLFDGIGAVLKRVWGKGFKEVGKDLAEWASERGMPVPFGAVAEEGIGTAAQKASRMLLPGDRAVISKLKDMAEVMTRELQEFTGRSTDIDAVAIAAKDKVAELVSRDAATESLQAIAGSIPEDQVVPVPTLRAWAAEYLQSAEGTGVKAKIKRELKAFIKRADSGKDFTRADLDRMRLNLREAAGKGDAGLGAQLDNAWLADIAGPAKAGGYKGDPYSEYQAAMESLADVHALKAAVPGIEQFARDFGAGGGTKGSIDFLTKLFRNPKAVELLRKTNPELFSELVEARMALVVKGAYNVAENTQKRYLNGEALRRAFEQNTDMFKNMLDADTFRAFDNFTKYAEALTPGMREAAAYAFDPTKTGARAVAEATAIIGKPMYALPAETASYILAKKLMDPDSALFHLFSEGVTGPTQDLVRQAARSLSVGAAGAAQQELAPDANMFSAPDFLKPPRL